MTTPEFMPLLIGDLKQSDNPRRFAEAILAMRGLLRLMYRHLSEEEKQEVWSLLTVRQSTYLTEALPPPLEGPPRRPAREIWHSFQQRQQNMTEDDRQEGVSTFYEEVTQQLKNEFGENMDL